MKTWPLDIKLVQAEHGIMKKEINGSSVYLGSFSNKWGKCEFMMLLFNSIAVTT